MIDDRIYYLDKNNKGQADQIITGFHITRTDNPNPNLSEIYEVEKISCAEFLHCLHYIFDYIYKNNGML